MSQSATSPQTSKAAPPSSESDAGKVQKILIRASSGRNRQETDNNSDPSELLEVCTSANWKEEIDKDWRASAKKQWKENLNAARERRNQAKQANNLRSLAEELSTGTARDKFLKHCRHSQPHMRLVCIKWICMKDATLLHSDDGFSPGTSPTILKLRRKNDTRNSECGWFIDWESGRQPLSTITGVQAGKTTKVFKRSNAEKSRVEVCFSVITTSRSLDLEAVDQATRDKWVEVVERVLKFKDSGDLEFLNTYSQCECLTGTVDVDCGMLYPPSN
eukprot:725839_1